MSTKYEEKKVSPSDLTILDDNPRQITESQFEKLKKSIKDFPEMLEIRRIVVADNVVLAGNMRLRAAIDLGLKEVPVVDISKLSKKKQKEFVIKDNLQFGIWDWDILANGWDNQLLADWGMPVWELDLSHIDNTRYEKEDDTPSLKGARDVDFVAFELIMFHENKKLLIEVINKVKEKTGLQTMEHALMQIINTYNENF